MNGLWTESFGEVGATLRALETQGITANHLKWLRSDSEMAVNLVRFWKKGAKTEKIYSESDSQAASRRTMGMNYLGPDDVARQFGVRFSDEELQQIATVPYKPSILRALKDDYILFLGYPLSIRELAERFPRLIHTNCDGIWGKATPQYILDRGAEIVSVPTITLRWYLMRIGRCPKADGLKYEDQVKKLESHELVPSANEMVYGVILRHLVNTEPLLTDALRCSDAFSNHEQVRVCHGGNQEARYLYLESQENNTQGCVYIATRYA